MRCKHQIIIENGGWTTTHYQEKDGSWWHDNESGEYSAMLEIECVLCKKYGVIQSEKLLNGLKYIWKNLG